MSKSDSNSEKSYDSDDSEINFIPGYVNIEVEEATLGEEDGATQKELDPDTYKPYEDEPIASEEWVSEYKLKQETQLEFERKLQDRSDGKQVVNTWCKCGRCSSDLLQNPNEFQCCLEIEECVSCLSSDIVLEEVGSKPNCMTEHPGFSQVCLQRWSLRLAADKYKTKEKNEVPPDWIGKQVRDSYHSVPA
ncbi:uncharacterized protein LOC144630128 isoform X1 [Oculina patagonica]